MPEQKGGPLANLINRWLAKKPSQEVATQDQKLPAVPQTPISEELEVSRVGVIDAYNPEVHKDAARFIEPRLSQLPANEGEMRRRYVGVISAQGTDWVFVNVGELPIQTQTSEEPFMPIKGTYKTPPGTYSYNNGVYMANAEGQFYISCLQKLAPGGRMVLADGATALHERGFKEKGGGVPFPSSDGRAVKLALLNAVAPGLAKDYFPEVRDAEKYKFYNTPEGEVMADIPPSQGAQILELPSAPKPLPQGS